MTTNNSMNFKNCPSTTTGTGLILTNQSTANVTLTLPVINGDTSSNNSSIGCFGRSSVTSAVSVSLTDSASTQLLSASIAGGNQLLSGNVLVTNSVGIGTFIAYIGTSTTVPDDALCFIFDGLVTSTMTSVSGSLPSLVVSNNGNVTYGIYIYSVKTTGGGTSSASGILLQSYLG